MRTYEQVSKNITSSIFRNIDPSSQKHLAKSIKGPGGKERPGHKYIRRKWNVTRQDWDYIYRDKQGREHIESRMPDKKEEKKNVIEAQYKEMTPDDFKRYHHFELSKDQQKLLEEAKREGKKIRVAILNLPFGNYLHDIEKIESPGGKKRKQEKEQTGYLNEAQETAVGNLKDMFSSDEYEVRRMGENGKAVVVFNVHEDIGAEHGIKSAKVVIDKNGRYKIASFSGKNKVENKTSVTENEPKEKSEYDKINEEYSEKGYVYIKSGKTGEKLRVEKYESGDESGHKVTNLSTGVKYVSVGRSGSPFKIFRNATLIAMSEQKQSKTVDYSNFASEGNWEEEILVPAFLKIAGENNHKDSLEIFLKMLPKGTNEDDKKKAERLAQKYADKMKDEKEFLGFAANVLEDSNFHEHAALIRRYIKVKESGISKEEDNILFHMIDDEEWHRKQTSFNEVESTFHLGLKKVAKKYKKIIDKLPIFYVDKNIDRVPEKNPEKSNNSWYLFKKGKNTFLVDPAGDSYPRHIVQIDDGKEYKTTRKKVELKDISQGKKLSHKDKMAFQQMMGDIHWERKPVRFHEVRYTHGIGDLVKRHKDIFDKLPVYEIEAYEDEIPRDNPNKEREPYIIKRGNKTYLVDPSGYDYPRYVARIDED